MKNYIIIKDVNSHAEMYAFIKKFIYNATDTNVDVDCYAGIIGKPSYWYSKPIIGVFDCKPQNIKKLLEEQENSDSLETLIISVSNSKK